VVRLHLAILSLYPKPKIIKLIFAFFSISILLFGSSALTISYSQPQVPPQTNPQVQQREEQKDLQIELQRLQRVQQTSELAGDEVSEEETAENDTGTIENDSDAFSYVTEVPSLRDLRKIQIETTPGSTLRANVIGPIAHGTPYEAAIGNSTSNGKLTSLANVTSLGNLTSLAEFKPVGNLTATIIARNPTTTEAVSDRAGSWSGCKTGYLGRVDPEWVPVRPTKGSVPWTDPVIAEGIVSQSRILVNYEEWPFSHHSHDRTFHFDLGSAYANLDSTRPGNMETEWEIGYKNTGITDRFPKEFWPWEGDTVWMMGWWVIDCGHFKLCVVGTDFLGNPIFQGCDYKTEIHPPFITAFTHIEPAVFSGEQNASTAAVTHIYLHGRGGNHDTRVGGQNYEFDIPMPKCTGPVITCDQRQLKYNVKSLPFGGPAPILTAKLLKNKAHVVIPLSNTAASPDLRYGAIVAAKWVNPFGSQTATNSTRTLRVTFDYITVYQDHDYGGAEWKNLWVGVNGKWIELSGPLGHYGLTDADDDDNHGTTYYFPAGSKAVTVIVPENGELKIKSTGWESDQDSCYLSGSPVFCGPATLAHVNNAIGYVDHVITCSRNFDLDNGELGVGSRPVSSGDDETNGDYSLGFHIDQLSRTVGTIGNCTGPAPVEVPFVECYDVDDAATIIQQAGLVPKYSVTGGPIVIHQVPSSGTIVENGSAVQLKRGSICP
jgi:hypothetical protein